MKDLPRSRHEPVSSFSSVNLVLVVRSHDSVQPSIELLLLLLLQHNDLPLDLTTSSRLGQLFQVDQIPL